MAEPFGELRPYDPSWRDKLAALLSGLTGDDRVGYQRAQKLTGLADYLPGTGTALAVDDTARDLQAGDYLGAGFSALGLVPGAGKVASKGGKKLLKEGRELLSEAVAKRAAKTGRQKAITATSLRQKPLDEAIEIARSEQHILPSPKGSKTTFVGAPYAARSRADIDALRTAFDRDVGLGGGGADWYQRAQKWIAETAGPDPARQHELAQNLALFSAQADPKGNLGFSVQARNAAIMGEPADVVRTGQQARTYNKAFQAGSDIPLGEKTGIYAQHLDPTMESPTTGTNDIWHARALGYSEPELNGGLSPQQHAWMDAETVLAVDRANRAATGGRTNWTPGEVQAAPWVAGKGRGLEARRNMTPEEGLAEAIKTYPDYAPSFTAYGTHEMTPGDTTGHLPGIAAGGDASKQAFAADPRSWWQGPGGRDILYDAQGAYVGPTQTTTGVFDNPMGERVINPGQAATPLISFTGKTGERVVDPNSAQMMTGTEAFRAMMDAQDAGAWSASIPGQKMGHMNAFAVPGQRERPDVLALMERGKQLGLPGIIDQGPQQIITDFGDPGLSAARVRQVQEAIPEAVPVRREGDYVGFDWTKGIGSDTVTREMLSRLNPAQEAALSKPEVRQAVLARMDRDIEIAKQRGGSLREDLQNARRIFGTGGIQGLKDALGKGLLPAVALPALMPYLMPQEGSEG